MILAEGTSFSGAGYVKTGLRIALLPKSTREDIGGLVERSNWLAFEVDFGRIFPAGGTEGITTFGGHLEMDISTHFALGGGVTYYTTLDTTISGSTLRIGGLAYDVVALRFYF